MTDELTRAIAEALGCEPDATDDKQGYACREHGDASTAVWPCPVLTEIAAALAPLIEARNVHREQQAFDRGYDKAMEGIEARVREARAEELVRLVTKAKAWHTAQDLCALAIQRAEEVRRG